MTRDLGMTGDEVHAQARAVLDFWFALSDEQHFAKEDQLDREIADRFGALRDAVFETGASNGSAAIRRAT